MIGAVDQSHLDVDHGEARNDSRRHHRIQALFDAGDELLRHRAADDLALELVALALLVGLDLENDARELARAAGLLLVGVVDFRRAGDRFAVGDLRRADR